MASKKKTKQEEANSVLENPEVLAEQLGRTEQFIENNKNLVLGALVAVIVVVAGVFGYRYYIGQQNDIAQSNLFQAIYYFEADSLSLALNGDGNDLGFLDIADEYSGTKAANLAHYYAGVTLLKQGQYADAVEHLESFSSNDLLIQAKSYCLIGDAHMELGMFEDAADYYNKAAGYKANEQFSPDYLMKAGLAYEKANDLKSAKESYDQVVDKYENSTSVAEARKRSAWLAQKIDN